MTDDTQRDIGRLEGRFDALEARIDKLEPKLDTVISWMERNTGTWKALVMVGSVGAALGSVVGWMVDHLFKIFK